MDEQEQPVEVIAVRDADGLLTTEATRRGGVLEGETVLYSSGRVKGRLRFQGGKQNGEAVFYDDAGEISVRANYKDGKLDGESQYFNAQGKLVRKARYEKGELHGRVVDYYLSGKPREIGHYALNVLDGELLRFGEDGTLTERLCFQQGKQKPCPPMRADARSR